MKKILLTMILIFVFITNSLATYPNYTVCPSSCDFNTLNGAIGDMKTNHATLDSPVTIAISGTWASADATATSISSIVTSSSNTISIYTTGSAVPPGYPAFVSPYYRLVVSGSGSRVLTCSINYVTIQGIQVENSYSGATNNSGAIAITNTSSSGNLVWDRIIAKTLGSGSDSTALDDQGNGSYMYFTNSIFIGAATLATHIEGTYPNGGAIFYNNIFVSYSSGAAFTLTASGGGGYGGILKNNYAYSQSGSAYSLSGTNTLATNASSDATGSTGLQSIPYTTATFNNVTSGSENFSLVSGSSLISAGTNLYGTFTDDIIGNTRQASGAWDIGVYKFTAVHTTTINLGSIYDATIN